MSRLERQRGDLEAAERAAAGVESLLERPGNRAGLLRVLCEEAHRRLAAHAPLETLLARIEELVAHGVADSDGIDALAALRRATLAADAGGALYHGELWEDLPSGLRHWLSRPVESASERSPAR